MRSSDSPWHLAQGVRATVPLRLRTGAVVHLWRPGPPPHLAAWYEPARAFAAAAPGVDVADLVFVGRLDGAAGPRWLYRGADGGELLLDLDGRPWTAVPCPRSRSGHRLEPTSVHAATAALRPSRSASAAHPAGGRSAPAGSAGDDGPLATVLAFRRR